MPTRTKTIATACCNKPLANAGQNAPAFSSHFVHAKHALDRPCCGCFAVVRDACLCHGPKIVQVLPTFFCIKYQRSPPSHVSILQEAGCLCVYPPPFARTLFASAILPMICPFNAPCWQWPGGWALWCWHRCNPGGAWQATHVRSGSSCRCTSLVGSRGRCGRRCRGRRWRTSPQYRSHSHCLDQETPRYIVCIFIQQEITAAVAPPNHYLRMQRIMGQAYCAERARPGKAKQLAGERSVSSDHHRRKEGGSGLAGGHV